MTSFTQTLAPPSATIPPQSFQALQMQRVLPREAPFPSWWVIFYYSCPRKQPDFMSVAQAAPRKRKRSSPDACEAENTSHISSKRQKIDESTRQARRTTRDLFWDTLSKVRLTPRALRQFDRRNAVQSREQRCTLDSELSPCKRSFIDISHLSAVSLENLKRFARRGGPSLTDLRGVSQATIRWEDECLYENLSVSRTITSVLKDHELSRVQLPEAGAVEQVQ